MAKSASRFYHITPAGKLVHVNTQAEALAAAVGEGFVWLDYCRSQKKELHSLIEPFGLHPLSVEDCTDDNQAPKIDVFPGNTFVIFNAFNYIVTSLMELHMSMLNNQMAKAANETNMTVRRLTFITTIFMPLTLLAGIGGMSEWSMMTGPGNWRIAYPAFLLGMAAIGVANYFLLKRLDK